MKKLIMAAGLLIALTGNSFAQTTQTSGNWSDPSVWSGGSVPASTGTVNVDNPVTIDGNLSPGGSWTFNSNATDQAGGTAYTFNPGAGTNTITVSAGSIVTFEGGTAGTPNQFSSGTILIYGTLVLGYTQLNNSGNLNITIEAGGALIINGDLTNKNNAGTFTVNGALIVNGNFANQTGSITVGGSGTINTTGSITTSGGSTVFGSTNDCNTGPCSGTTLACTFTNTITPASKVLCSGSSGITLTSVNSATSPTYQWLSSTDGVTYANAPGTSTGSTYTTPALTQTTWYKVTVKTSGGCTSTSAEVKLTVLSGGGWLGGTSNDWGTASNWCSNVVPTSATDVTITNASGISNMPTINAGTAAAARSVTISNTYPASSLTIAASGTASLRVYGNLALNGSFTDNSTASTAGVILAGNVAQTISGSTAPVFNNLTINNSSGASSAVTLASNNVSVNSNLTLVSGTVNLGGNTLTLGASGTSTGVLNYTTGASLYGGNLVRWFPTAAVTLGSDASLFPLGDGSNYRPMYFGSSGLSTAGTIKVSHTGVNGATAVSFTDGASTILVRSNSYWTVSTGNGIGSTGSPFTVRSEGTGFGVIGNVSDLRLTLSAAAASGTAGVNANSVSDPQVNRTAFSVSNLANTYYWGSVSPGFTTLPVDLVSFTAQPQSGDVLLSWKTAAEADGNFFSLERSADGANFQAMARIPAAGGPGFGHQYLYTDQSPGPGRNYYRLKIVDAGGAVSYSGVAMVNFAADNGLVLFPSPSDGRSVTARVNVAGGSIYTVDVYNDQGILVRHVTASTPVLLLRFSPALPPGVYVARVSSPGYNAVGAFLVRL
jgi:hypothetical protein